MTVKQRPDRYLVGYPASGNWVYGKQWDDDAKMATLPMTAKQAERNKLAFHQPRSVVIYELRIVKARR